MRIFKSLFGLAAILTLAGCHSAYIAATVSNHTSRPLTLIEVDYPSASFGTQTLAPGQDFHYRYKVLGNGPTTILWTDSANHEQKNAGPPLKEGDEGQMSITFDNGSTPTWNLHLINRSPTG